MKKKKRKEKEKDEEFIVKRDPIYFHRDFFFFVSWFLISVTKVELHFVFLILTIYIFVLIIRIILYFNRTCCFSTASKSCNRVTQGSNR